MLSGETSVGAFPIEAVRTMGRIIESTETHGLDRVPPLGTTPFTQGGAISLAASKVGEFVKAKYYLRVHAVRRLVSSHGSPAHQDPRARLHAPHVARHMPLDWSAKTGTVERATHTDEMIGPVDEYLIETSLAHAGGVVVVTGMPPGRAATTSNLRVSLVGRRQRPRRPA